MCGEREGRIFWDVEAIHSKYWSTFILQLVRSANPGVGKAAHIINF